MTKYTASHICEMCPELASQKVKEYVNNRLYGNAIFQINKDISEMENTISTLESYRDFLKQLR